MFLSVNVYITFGISQMYYKIKYYENKKIKILKYLNNIKYSRL